MRPRTFTVINKSGENLACVEVLPKDNPDGKFPVAILCHGFAYYKEEDGLFADMGIADRLQRRGYAVYYFDFSGCGESQGDYQNTSLTKLVDDLKSVYATISGYDYINETDLNLIGQSFGTSVVIASQLPNLRHIVLCGSFYNPYTLISGLFQDFHEFGISKRTKYKSERVITMGSQFWSDLKTYDLVDSIRAYDCPILFVHGALDKTVPIGLMRPLLEAAQQPVGPVILPASDHGLQPERAKVLEAVTDFFI